MTYDKIKHYMNPFIFNHWVHVKDTKVLNRAKNLLSAEIDKGLVNGIEYHAELNLLKLLTN